MQCQCLNVNLFDIIIEHKIDIQHVPKLITEKDMIRELIPNIGERLNFISKYEELSKKKDNVSWACLVKYLYYFPFIYIYIFYYGLLIGLLYIIRTLLSVKWEMMAY